MLIKEFTKEYWQQLIDFNCRMYPTRNNVDALQRFRMIDCPNKRDLGLNIVLIDDEGNVRGQCLSNSTNCYLSGVQTDCTWGYDLVVDPELRAMNYGIDILEFKRDNQRLLAFATGVNDTALKIHKLLLKTKVIGQLKKYIKLINPLYVPCSIWRKISFGDYPMQMDDFRKVDCIDKLRDIQIPYNEDLIEFLRDKSFMEWRYFKAPHTYAVYQSMINDDFFVVRTIVQKHITCLVLVDYRCKQGDFNVILDAAIRITKCLRLSVLISASSLAEIDVVFDRYGFNTIGKHRTITANKYLKVDKEKIDIRSYIFVTLSDSDGEICW